MKNYFEVTVKFDKVLEDGKVKNVSEKYLVDAISFTEAEARIIKEMKEFIFRGFKVTGIIPKKIAGLFFNGFCDIWYSCKVCYTTLNENTGKDKKTFVIMFSQGNSVEDARYTIKDKFKGSMADWSIVSISETKIINVFEHECTLVDLLKILIQ